MVTLLKEREKTWSINRAGRQYVVEGRDRIESNDGMDIYRKHRIHPRIGGGATAPTPASAASSASATLNQFLSIAPTKYYAILGTVATGSAGGSTANVIWQQQIPIIPAFCTAIDYYITLPVTLTLGVGNVTTTGVTLSPFAPYSAIANQFTLGGAPPWSLTECTPWHIDETQHKIDYDPYFTGLGNMINLPAPSGSVSNPFANVLDQGPALVAGVNGPQVIGGSGSLNPGSVVTNATTAAVSSNYSFTFSVRINLQRKRHLLWGAVPFGDPENRPNNVTQIFPLLGTLPEQCLFVNGGTGGFNTVGNSVVLNGAATVLAVYNLQYIDLLPPGVQSPPAPAVGYGLQLVTSSPSGQSAGTIFPMTHRTAMVYTGMHHIVVNTPSASAGVGGLPIQADYFGIWDDQDVQSSRFNFDLQNNTFMQYFVNYHRNYRRYPYKGVYSYEPDDGVFPEVPSVTPYVGLMTPDASYASAFGLPVTPAMTSSMRIPSGTTLINSYIRLYEFGLVRVPY